MVSGKIWLSLTLMATAVTASREAFCQTTTRASTGVASSPVPQPAAVLLDPAATNSQRDQAAEQLVGGGSTTDIAAIANALANRTDPVEQLAAAKALAGNPRADPALLEPLLALLSSGDLPLSRAAAGALAAFRDQPQVVRRLNDQARNGQNEGQRIAAIEALGHMIDKSSAATLVSLLTNRDEREAVRQAASEALVKLTGLVENDHDTARWAQWWNLNSNKSDADFRTEILLNRASRLDALDARHRVLADQITNELTEQFRAAPAAARAEILVRMLNSAAPEIRVLGAQNLLIMRQEVPVPDAAMQRLRQLIADGDSQVRFEAANALKTLNDKESFESLLAQLQRERDVKVRAALIGALGRIGELRAVPTLIRLLSDESTIVAKAAADAIRDLGPSIHQADPNLAHQTALALLPLLVKPPRSDALRESAADAIAELRDPAMLDPLHQLLSQRESIQIQRSALHGLGLLGSASAVELIVPYLTNREPRLQLQAIDALKDLKSIENLDSLYHLMDSSDQSVSKAAWEAIVTLLPALTDAQLALLQTNFHDRKQWEHELAVLQQEAKIQRARSDPELGGTMQNIGAAQMELGRFGEAAAALDEALSLKLQQQPPVATVILRIVVDRMRALLRDKDYAQAITFGEEQIKRDRNTAEPIGKEIKDEVERLAPPGQKDPATLKAAEVLIDQAIKMDPPLEPRHVSLLGDIRKGIEKQLSNPTQ